MCKSVVLFGKAPFRLRSHAAFLCQGGAALPKAFVHIANKQSKPFKKRDFSFFVRLRVQKLKKKRSSGNTDVQLFEEEGSVRVQLQSSQFVVVWSGVTLDCATEFLLLTCMLDAHENHFHNTTRRDT